MVSQIQYTRSHRRGRLPKIWAIYLKACGLSARAFDAIHSLGITMSHKWAANAYGILSELKMKEVRAVIHTKPWTISHDNVNLPLRVFSQRLHNQSHFVSGCAATVWVLPNEATLPPDANRLLQKHRANHCNEKFSIQNILYGDETVDKRIEAQHIFRVLRILLDSPEFSDYQHHDSKHFSQPPAVNKLPSGPQFATQEFILGTSELEEASYDGTLKVVADLFRQLHLHTEEEEIRTGLERVIAWMGDQLTVERLRGLWKYRHEDFNSFDRMDYMIPVFGWFHLVMAFANSLHKQYLGTSAGIGGMRQAFDILKRTGLVTQSTKGPFWHHLDEAIHHISEAHFRSTWLVVGKVKKLAELKTKSPEELCNLAKTVIQEHACREALVHLDKLPVEEQDHVQRQWIMWNTDVLPYLELRDAMKHGDVGRMEDLFPTLLFRFVGGGNPKYAIEILELLQGLQREWPDAVWFVLLYVYDLLFMVSFYMCSKYIREWCWLMNQAGKADSFLPFDLGQEENICDIKVDFHSMGPGAKMAYMYKVSPAIPTLRAVQRHIEKQFKTVSRGGRHGVPDKEKDVQTLVGQYVDSDLHIYKPGRKIKVSIDRSTDFISVGVDNLERTGTINEWFTRRSHPRSTAEDWGSTDSEKET